MTWLQIFRVALLLLGAIREKTQRTCPNENCPLKLNKAEREKTVKDVDGKVVPKITKASVDEQIRRQKALYKKNHPNG